MLRLSVLVHGVLAYLIFLASSLYAAGFVGGLVVPKTIDSESAGAAYVLIALQLEERNIVACHGGAYTGYQRQVRMLVPLPKGTSRSIKA